MYCVGVRLGMMLVVRLPGASCFMQRDSFVSVRCVFCERRLNKRENFVVDSVARICHFETGNARGRPESFCPDRV